MIYSIISGVEPIIVIISILAIILLFVFCGFIAYDDVSDSFSNNRILASIMFFVFGFSTILVLVGVGFYNTRIEEFDKYMSICTHELKYVQCSTDSNLYNAYTKISEEDFVILLEKRKSQ